MRAIKQRLDKLEKRYNFRPFPSFEEYTAQWAATDELSKSIIIFCAERPDMWSKSERPYMTLVREYLGHMGLVDSNAPSLSDIVAELESKGGNYSEII